MQVPRLFRTEGHILALACVALALVVQVVARPRPISQIDIEAVVAAASLLDHGVFADIYVPKSAGQAMRGRAIAPGYPAAMATLALLDSRMARAIRCHAAGRVDCADTNAFLTLLAAQTLACIVALALACFLALELSGSAEVAGLTTLLTFVMGVHAKVAEAMIPYAIVSALALTFCALLVVAHRRRSILIAAAAGLVLGVLVLFEVYYLALLSTAPALLVAVQGRRPGGRRPAFASASALVLAAGFVIAPWMARSYYAFGDLALTRGRESLLFAERVAYSHLTFTETLVGLVYWTPVLGNLSGALLPAASVRKFGMYVDGSLLMQGIGILAEARAAAGPEGTFLQLLRAHVFDNASGHAGSSALLVVRGLAVTGGPLVLWGLLALPLLLRRLKAAGRLGPFLLVGAPLLGLTVVQGVLTGNLPWMNLPLLFVYAYAIAHVAGGLELPIGLRRWFDDAAQVSAEARPAVPGLSNGVQG